jgi:hypothetical protein
MKTKILFLMVAAAIMVVGCKDSDDEENEGANTLPYAATTQTWTFGDQTWSDAIQCPECNKETFENSYTEPHCRSYTENGKTWYYYNWAYVKQNAATLCPSPWRVPSRSDFEILANNTWASALIDAWGYGGDAYSSSIVNSGSYAYYWSSTGYENGFDYAYSLLYRTNGYVNPQNTAYKYYGLQVRCVK